MELIMNSYNKCFTNKKIFPLLLLFFTFPYSVSAAENTIPPLQYSHFFWGYSGGCVSTVGLDEQMIREYIKNQEQLKLEGL